MAGFIRANFCKKSRGNLEAGAQDIAQGKARIHHHQKASAGFQDSLEFSYRGLMIQGVRKRTKQRQNYINRCIGKMRELLHIHDVKLGIWIRPEFLPPCPSHARRNVDADVLKRCVTGSLFQKFQCQSGAAA